MDSREGAETAKAIRFQETTADYKSEYIEKINRDKKNKKQMADIRERCDVILQEVRKYKTKNTAKRLERLKSQPGNVKQLNNFIFEQHEKLNLKKRSDDPQIPERALEITIDN